MGQTLVFPDNNFRYIAETRSIKYYENQIVIENARMALFWHVHCIIKESDNEN